MIANASIVLTAHDYNKLKLLLADLNRQSRGLRAGAETLEEILDIAHVVEPRQVPENVITMNSTVLFEDVRTLERGTVTIVYPTDVDVSTRRISILSPMGAALIGEVEGSEVEMPVPHGRTRRVRILDVVYQPEARGEFER